MTLHEKNIKAHLNWDSCYNFKATACACVYVYVCVCVCVCERARKREGVGGSLEKIMGWFFTLG